MIPEEEAVTKAEQTILFPFPSAAALYLIQQQTLDISLHCLAEFSKPTTLKVPVRKRRKEMFFSPKKDKNLNMKHDVFLSAALVTAPSIPSLLQAGGLAASGGRSFPGAGSCY